MNAALELNLTAHYEGSRLSFRRSLARSFAAAVVVVGVVVWFPLQISERNRTRNGKGGKEGGRKKGEERERAGANGENDQQWRIPACKKLGERVHGAVEIETEDCIILGGFIVVLVQK